MGHASEGDEIVKRRSFLTDKRGEIVANEQITMVDDGTIPGAYGSTGRPHFNELVGHYHPRRVWIDPFRR